MTFKYSTQRMLIGWRRLLALSCVWLGCVLAAGAASSTNSLVWNKAKDRVDADVRDWELFGLLERVAQETGWHVYVEPGLPHKASAKFKQLPSGEALRSLLGDLNFAVVPQTNANPHLYVFRTSMARATQMVRSRLTKPPSGPPRKVANQLIVRVKPGVDINQLAELLGATVKGSIPELNAYLLEFADAAATEAARLRLTDNSQVSSVDYNYYVDSPETPRGLQASSAAPISLQLKPAGEGGQIIVGLIDTAMQSMGKDLDAFMLAQISVAGQAAMDPNSPSHATSMAETMLRVLEQYTQGKTSVKILPVDVYGPNAETTSWNVALGIQAAVNNNATVLNLSLGGGGDSAVMRDLVQAVSARGIPMFAAAGNEPVATPFYPAAYPSVVAVTAGQPGRIADYANYGSFVDIAAPDTSVVYFNGRPWYVMGTSAATAYTTGVAAGLADTTHRSWSEIQAAIMRNLAVKPSGK